MDLYLNPDAFRAPAPGTLGNLGRGSTIGPGTWAFDLALSRSFGLSESRRFEVRAEAYNITNSFRPVNPNTQLTNRTFGQIRAALDPRIMQFALKYVF
jgi:hypothetical protein